MNVSKNVCQQFFEHANTKELLIMRKKIAKALCLLAVFILSSVSVYAQDLARGNVFTEMIDENVVFTEMIDGNLVTIESIAENIAFSNSGVTVNPHRAWPESTNIQMRLAGETQAWRNGSRIASYTRARIYRNVFFNSIVVDSDRRWSIGTGMSRAFTPWTNRDWLLSGSHRTYWGT